MMRALSSILLCLIAHLSFGQFNFQNLDVVYSHGLSAAYKPRVATFQNLRLYPIMAKTSFIDYGKQFGTYTPLKDALDSGWVTITEYVDTTSAPARRALIDSADYRGDRRYQQQANYSYEQIDLGSSGTVNTLYVENLSKDTVFLMAGEVVKGGKQDRAIAQDLVLPPNSGKVAMPVFCVERGRWHYNDSTTNFGNYFQMSGSSVRSAVITKKNQSDVWGEVDRVHQKNKTATPTSTYTAIASSEEFLKQQQAYLDFFKKEVGYRDMIGLVAVSGNQIIGCDLFASPDLFQQSADKILQSYITEAITHGSEVGDTDAMVQEYLQKLLASDEQQERYLEEQQKGKIFKDKSRKVHISAF